MTTETTTVLPLEERLRLLADATAPDKTPSAICKIIEVRRFIAEQRLRGHSWAALARMLAQEGLNLAAGSLRNYMAQIGRAEEHLHASGNSDPSDSEIHAALRQKQAAPQRPAVQAQRRPSPALVVSAPPPLSTTTTDPYENL